MPSFVCDTCQETLKKPKLDQHVQRCRGASFSCIDCSKSFKGVEYRAHVTCITEVEKHHLPKGPDGKILVPQKRKEETKKGEKEEDTKKRETTEVKEMQVLDKIVEGTMTFKEVKRAMKSYKISSKWLTTNVIFTKKNGKVSISLLQ